MKNPSLREAPRTQAAPIMESRQDASILDWLEGTGRLMEREVQDRAQKEDEMEEINALMAGDDGSFEVDDDDDDGDEV